MLRSATIHMAIAAAAVAVTVQVTPVLADAPNMLLIIADDLGVSNIRCYTQGPNAVAGDPPPTDNIDALAADGVLFRNAWVAPVCSPTRANLYTGRYGFRTGVRQVVVPGVAPLATSEITLPELLDAQGYSSGLFGKWHLGNGPVVGGSNAPNVQGFDQYSGVLSGALDDYFSWSRTVNGVTATSTTYATTANVDDALAWVGTQSSPWLCVLAFNAPHSPFHAPPAALHSYNLAGANSRLRYKAMIEAMDTEIGRMIAGLGAAADNTVIVFIGDNGTPQQVIESPYTTYKGQVYEGGVLVPLIVKGPGVVGGREVFDLVHGVDLFATIAELGGVNLETALAGVTIDGISVKPLLEGTATAHSRTLLYTEMVTGTAEDGLYAVRDNRYKLAQLAGLQELYDLEVDPFESSNLLIGGGLSAVETMHLNILRAELDRLIGAGLLGDLNGDGTLSAIDATALAQALVAPDEYIATRGLHPLRRGDFNSDDLLDGDDIAGILSLIYGG